MASITCKPGHPAGIAFTFHSFDLDYLERLASRDAAIERHFADYFGDLLTLKLRFRIRSPQLAEDIRQETLSRVLQVVRKNRVQCPERFGGFVNAVCNNVMRELIRRETRHERLEDGFETPDKTAHADDAMVTQQTRLQVQTVLDELPAKDREILRMLFLQDRTGRDVCRRFGITGGYHRVLLQRAKARFQKLYAARYRSSPNQP
jgi:RNA polymerase sigma-70 factor (ECF subfamily)